MSTQVLTVNSSLFGSDGASSTLNRKVLAELESTYGELSVKQRNLAESPLPYFDGNYIQALSTPAAERTAEQREWVALADTLIKEVKAADVLVVAAPMYNFGIPAQLKTWLDYLARAGETFKYTESGPVGLIGDKPVFITATRGGEYVGTPMDSQTPFLTTFFNFLGLKDIRFVYAEGLNMGKKDQSFEQAETRIKQWVKDYA